MSLIKGKGCRRKLPAAFSCYTAAMGSLLTEATACPAAQPTLPERVCAYLRYKCENGRFKGVENAAFHLHCSPRQLQRVLNALERDGAVRKIGKGSYELSAV